MKLSLSPEVIASIPGITVYALVLKVIRNTRKNSNVAQLLRGVIMAKKSEIRDDDKKKQLLSSLKNTAVESATLRETHLLKSLINRISTGKEIAVENNLKDLAHYWSLKYLVPVFGYDLDQVEKDIEIDFFIPKKGKKTEDMAFLPETTTCVIWLTNTGTLLAEEFNRLPQEFAKTLIKYCGAEIETYYKLDAENPEIDLQYTSQKEIEYRELLAQEEEAARQRAQILASDDAPFMEESSQEVSSEPMIRDILRNELQKTVSAYLSSQNLVDQSLSEVQLEVPQDLKNGDYASSVALKISKLIGRTPRDTAADLLSQFSQPEFIEKIDIVEPGFINFHVSHAYLIKEIDKIIALRGNYGRLAEGKGHKVMIEYSSPNIAKPLGVHHLLSTVIGQTLVNLLKFGSYDVVAVNYPGDWGTQFGKLLYAYKNWSNEETVKADPLNELLKLYVRFHSEAEHDPSLDDKGREEFKKLEEGDQENYKLWQWIKDLSIQEIERLYSKLGVKFDLYLGEQMYLVPAREVITDGLEKGLITQGEKGALIIEYPGNIYPPFIVQKGDGTTLYSTRDLASIRDRIDRFHPEKLIYVVDVAQSLHFKQLFAAASMLGYSGAEFKHVIFGRMQLPEGRMSTRKGDIILMDEVLKEAISRTEKIVEEKNPQLSSAERKSIAEAMAVSAIKYNIISQNRETNITFQWDKMLSLDGNSAPYLQYAYVRTQSILRKSREAGKITAFVDENQIDIFSLAGDITPHAQELKAEPFSHEAELRIMHMLPHFAETIEMAISRFSPHLLTTYLYELARAFSGFYSEVNVINTPSEKIREARLKLVRAVSQVLKNGLSTLGISVFEKM